MSQTTNFLIALGYLESRDENYMKNLKEICNTNIVGLDLKTLVYLALPIYWAIIILAPFSH